ncbi:ABC transporter permease [Morganella morganii]|uniref:ABC transporter permease n=1 Tax=Morganella morganii TaxID=582 RepID=UPI000D1DA188|nr:ABC transporter permease [Morganella morganii]HAE78052.1 sugar ABC transporter permease [Morganella sp. (in: enterobacteria)]EJD6039114.1 ABC transporter permease [Morganella morganii]QXO44313.1 ABC transporter permease [Morganella morganii]QXO47905.1 ABC transporter permease [Morganella morganii]QXO51698.1 ABC transporter permease [Morganella morganii]
MLKSCRHLFAHHEFWLAVLIVLLSVFLSVTNEDFMTLGNVFDMTTSTAILAIMACGLFVVLVSGGIDISFPATAATAQYVMATYVLSQGGNFFIAFAIAAVVGLLLGLINALLIYRLKVPSIIITISTLNVFFGLLIYFTNGEWLYGFPEWFMDGVEVMSFTGSDGYDYGLSLPILTLIAVIIFTGFLMSKTRVGRQIYAVGGNADAAKRVGISILGVMLFVYGYMGALAGIASVVQTQITQSVAPNALMGFELTVLAAVVLGGVSMTGGKGTLTGVILGVALLAIVKNGLTLAGVPSYWHTVLTGLIIVISISFTAYNEKRRAAAGGHLS